MKEIVESYSVVTQVKPLVRPHIQLPKLEKSELDMTSEEKVQYIYQDSKLLPTFICNRRYMYLRYPLWLVWVKIECTVHFAMTKQPIN